MVAQDQEKYLAYREEQFTHAYIEMMDTWEDYCDQTAEDIRWVLGGRKETATPFIEDPEVGHRPHLPYIGRRRNIDYKTWFLGAVGAGREDWEQTALRKYLDDPSYSMEAWTGIEGRKDFYELLVAGESIDTLWKGFCQTTHWRQAHNARKWRMTQEQEAAESKEREAPLERLRTRMQAERFRRRTAEEAMFWNHKQVSSGVTKEYGTNWWNPDCSCLACIAIARIHATLVESDVTEERDKQEARSARNHQEHHGLIQKAVRSTTRPVVVL